MKSKYFTEAEFACKCGCGFKDISQELVDRLDMIREKMGTPLRVNSGCRCEAYNRKIGGESISAHCRGWAADLHLAGSTSRYIITRLAYLYGFKRVGQYPNFIHLDVADETFPQYVMWFGQRKA